MSDHFNSDVTELKESNQIETFSLVIEKLKGFEQNNECISFVM